MSALNGFIGGGYLLDTIQFDCQNCVNLYPEADEAGTGSNQSIGQLVCTPGLAAAVTIAGGSPIRCLYTSTAGLVYAACSDKVYQITEDGGVFTATQIGSLQTSIGSVSMIENSGLLWIVDGDNGYTWQNSIFKQIDDPAWQGANFVVFLADQFIFNVPSTNEFYWSDLNASTFTLAGGYGDDAKQGNSDPIVGMQVYGLFLWLMGSQTTEIWTTNATATTSYQRIPGPYLQSGCLAGNTAAFTEYGGIWLSTNPRGGAQVVMTPAQGYTIKRISTYAVEQALQEYNAKELQSSTAFIYQQKGHIFYQLNPTNGKSSWVYDITSSLQVGKPIWHERTYTNSSNQQSRHLADNHCLLNGYHLVGDYSTGNIYVLDPLTYTDNGAIITRTRTAPHVANGFNRIFYNAITILLATGKGLSSTYNNPGAPLLANSCGSDPLTSTVNWTAGSVGSNPILSYSIWRSTISGSGFTQIANVNNSTFTYTDSTLVLGTTYYYYVTAIDTNLQPSAPSNTQSCTTTAPPPPVSWTLEYQDSPTGNSSPFSQITSSGNIGFAGDSYPQIYAGTDSGTSWGIGFYFPTNTYQLWSNSGYTFGCDNNAIYSSTDTLNWTQVSLANYNMYNGPLHVTLDQTSGITYINQFENGSSTNVSLWRILNGQNTATQLANNTSAPNFFNQLKMTGLVVSDGNSTVVTGSYDGNGTTMYASTDGGATFNPTNPFLVSQTLIEQFTVTVGTYSGLFNGYATAGGFNFYENHSTAFGSVTTDIDSNNWGEPSAIFVSQANHQPIIVWPVSSTVIYTYATITTDSGTVNVTAPGTYTGGGYQSFSDGAASNINWTVGQNYVVSFYGLPIYNGINIQHVARGFYSWLAVGYDNNTNQIASYISHDAIGWTTQTETTNGPPYRQYLAQFGNYYITSDGNNLATSFDGTNWNAAINPLGSSLFGIYSTSERVYLYGLTGIAESTDGINYVQTLTLPGESNIQAVNTGSVTLACGQIPYSYPTSPGYNIIYKRSSI